MHIAGPNFQSLNRLRADNLDELQKMIRHTLRLLKPQQVKGHNKVRFGSVNDGGYVMLDDFTAVDTAISMGIEQNIDWDIIMADRGMTVHQFDHTVNDPAPTDDRMVFNKIMIAPQDGEGCESIRSIVERLDKSLDRPNLVLKMDIECSEWDALEATSLDVLSRFSQITCELHGFNFMEDLGWRQRIFRGLRKLQKFYAPIHVHANNYAGWAIIAGIPVPAVLEATFVNRQLYEVEESHELFPTSLDVRCDPRQPDLYLGRFEY